MAKNRRVYRDEEVRISDLARENLVLDDYTFHSCVINGPAVLTSLGATRFLNCSFVSPDIFIEVHEDKALHGVIGANNCTFDNCTFSLIGIIGSASFIDRFIHPH